MVKWPKPSPTSLNCHQLISSPLSVTNIDVARKLLVQLTLFTGHFEQKNQNHKLLFPWEFKNNFWYFFYPKLNPTNLAQRTTKKKLVRLEAFVRDMYSILAPEPTVNLFKLYTSRYKVNNFKLKKNLESFTIKIIFESFC